MAEKMMVPGMSRGIVMPVDVPAESVHQQIVDFVTGRNDGGELMLALYGDIVDEPLPPRLADLIAGWRAH
jgi:hypothetical protein